MTRTILILFALVLQTQNGFSQKPNLGEWEAAKDLAERKVDTLDINSVRNALHSNRPYLSTRAAIYLALKGIEDIKPSIKRKFDSLDINDKYFLYGNDYLFALFLLRYSQAHDMTLAFLDSSIIKHKKDEIYTSPLEISVILCLLARMGDYNHFNLLDSIITVAPDEVNWELIEVYMTNGYKEPIFNRLKTLVHHPKEQARKMLVWALESYLTYPETQNLYREVAQNDSGWVRFSALKILMQEYKDPIVLDVCAQMLLTTNNWHLMYEATFIFENFQSPLALAKLIEVEKQMPGGVFITGRNPTFPPLETKQYIANEIKDYKPPVFEGSVLLAIDSLKNYTLQSQNYNWLGNQHFVKELTKKLDEAKKHLTKPHASTKDSLNCAKEVRKFQKKVNEVYKETLEKEKKHEKREKKFVTIEGWKFLYYNAQYILDRLPALKKDEEEEDN